MHVSTFGADALDIPTGSMAHPVTASLTLPGDAVGISLFAHMHLRGRDVTVVAESPDGNRQTLLVMPNYNFGAQEAYLWPRGAQSFLKGTKLHALAHFDNSRWNPANPDPGKVVRCGPGTMDEQLQVSLTWVARDEALGIAIDPATGTRAVTPAPPDAGK